MIRFSRALFQPISNRKGYTKPLCCQIVLRFVDHICLAPVVRRQSCKQPTANRFPRNFTSAWFSPGRPLWLRRHAMRCIAAKYASHICVFNAVHCFNARLLTGRGVAFRSLSWRNSCGAAALSVSKETGSLLLSGAAGGKYLQTDYWVFKEQRRQIENAPHFPWRKVRGLHTLKFNFLKVF